MSEHPDRSDTTLLPRAEPETADPSDEGRLALVVIWDQREPSHAAEIAWIEPGTRFTFGRIGGRAPHRLRFVRHRPGGEVPGQPFSSPYLSRDQLSVTAIGHDTVEVDNIGRSALKINGIPVQRGRARVGDVLEIDRELVLLLWRRSIAPGDLTPAMSFGDPDRDGMVGESQPVWALRRWIEAVAPFPGHVLVHGGSGTGKELVANALHARSGRKGPLVSCNAAAIPTGVAEAEWFGNIRDYPNPGMPQRRGLAGEADGGTLFIDELGEMPEGVQAQLLRLLDSGEVQRLGAPRPVRVDIRVIAATNRPLGSRIKPDLLARFTHRRELPSLSARLDDLPLLVNHLLAPIAQRQGRPLSLRPRLWTALLRHRWSLGVRELHQILAAATVHSTTDALDVSSEMPLDLPPTVAALPVAEPREISPEQIREALLACGGVKSEAARQLGLNTRHQLRRLMTRYGIEE